MNSAITLMTLHNIEGSWEGMWPLHLTMSSATTLMTSHNIEGSWEGMWGICFTYGTWFGIEGLIDAGFAQDHPAVTKACEYLLSKQQDDGGWGETFMSCVTREYVQHPQSQVVNTVRPSPPPLLLMLLEHGKTRCACMLNSAHSL
jgi:squalene cyclase